MCKRDMNKLSCLFFFLITALPDLFSQDNHFYPLDHFIPDQFVILDTTSGNLNKDALNDLVLILREKRDTSYETLNRPLLLLEGNGKGSYSLIAQNDKVVLCSACGGMSGDPYQETVIKNGFFTIEHYGGSAWRWTRFITFKYDSQIKNFRLNKDGMTSFHSLSPNDVEESYHIKESYGKLLFEDFDLGL